MIAALRGRDCLAVLPTGGGKSVCYQVPALLLPRLTVVVSPLISLMQDQVSALRTKGVPAAYLSSTQKPDLRAKIWQAVGEGRIKLLYVAPERMTQLVAAAPKPPVSLLAIDEAHCISEWGHDFRPHYRSLGRHRAALGFPPIMAVTATATPATREDIGRILYLRKPVRVLRSFDRPNLRFAVHRFRTEHERLRQLCAVLKKTPGTAIVYVPTRDRTDGVANILIRWGLKAAPYHAGLPGSARRALLAQFMSGQIRAMVATTAFGMGIDKSDVRLIVHLGIPPRPEAYYQEAGRAGRDGEISHCELLWIPQDLELTRHLSGLEQVAPGERAHAHVMAKRRGLDTMKCYVTTNRCRRRVLLEYLGERVEKCAGCDRCQPVQE